MGIAHASFSLRINSENPLAVVEDLLLRLDGDFLKPKSMQVHLVGSGTAEKIERSLDGGNIWPKHELPASLPGEREVAETDFTTLEDAEKWLAIPRDSSQIVERLKACSEKSVQLLESKQALDDDVFWTFWGLTKAAYSFDGSRSNVGYFLRQRLDRVGRREPLMRVIGHLTQKPQPYVYMSFLVRSFVWSHYTPSFDTAKQEWVAKPQLLLEQENARLFAETISSFVRRYPNAEVEWESEQEHSPDLRGFVPSELQSRLGPPGISQRVSNLGMG